MVVEKPDVVPTIGEFGVKRDAIGPVELTPFLLIESFFPVDSANTCYHPENNLVTLLLSALAREPLGRLLWRLLHSPSE